MREEESAPLRSCSRRRECPYASVLPRPRRCRRRGSARRASFRSTSLPLSWTLSTNLRLRRPGPGSSWSKKVTDEKGLRDALVFPAGSFFLWTDTELTETHLQNPKPIANMHFCRCRQKSVNSLSKKTPFLCSGGCFDVLVVKDRKCMLWRWQLSGESTIPLMWLLKLTWGLPGLLVQFLSWLQSAK